MPMFVELQSRFFRIDNQMGSQVYKMGEGTIHKVRQHFLAERVKIELKLMAERYKKKYDMEKGRVQK